MFRIVSILVLIVSSASYAVETIDGVQFVTRSEYHRLGKPCACPSDAAKNGRCGKRAALCRSGGYNILDCGGKSIQSLSEYLKVQQKFCY